MARGGNLPAPMEVRKFADYAKRKLGVSYGLLVPAGKEMVSSVATVGGGGWSFNQVAQKEGYDIFVSGDIPHHGRREIILRHYDYLELSHEIERIFIKQMTKILLNIDLSLTIISIDHEKKPELI
jgi:putative NIF3 family GTP cyclohydrolase 1 type 2